MLPTVIVTALCTLFVPAALAQVSVPVSYDTAYDVASASLDTVACSDGSHGLEPKYTTFGSLPNFPFVGGASVITSWNSPNCGTCWELTYNGANATILAIDAAKKGFNLSLQAMNILTNGQAEKVGRVTASAVQVDQSQCGL